MPPVRPRLTHRRSLAWLLWLAVLWPLAQGLSTWHPYSHLGSQAEGSNRDGQAHAEHCDLCASAATASGTALAHAPALGLLAGLRHHAPALFPPLGVRHAPALGYQSRAPPSFA